MRNLFSISSANVLCNKNNGRRRIVRICERLEDRMVLSAQPFLQVAPIGNYSDGPVELTVSGDALYFVGDDSQYGRNAQLWKTDGTVAGTGALTGNPRQFRPRILTDVDGQLFFAANHTAFGVELWTSDGTIGGTTFVADVNPNNNGGPGPSTLTNIGGELYFTGGWWSDVELWRSDGTSAGTTQVHDINPNSGSGPYNFVEIPGGLLFTANDGQFGYELWRSDGTSAGTELVKDIRPGEEGAGEYNLTDFKMTRVGDNVFFVADDGTHGRELWWTDGTTAGTELVIDLLPGSQSANPTSLTAFNGALYFTANVNGQSGLWSSDGTAAGTVLVKSLTSASLALTAGDTLFFTGDDGVHGRELWKSDGTAAGTVMVADVRAGAESSESWIRGSAPLPGGGYYVYFTANDGVHGSELWRSDGTADGTVLVREIVPGTGTFWIGDFEYFDGHVYFSYNKGLWRTSVVNAGPPVADAGGPYTLLEGHALTFDASATTDPDPDDIIEYSWDVNGDGVYGDATGVQPTLSWHELVLLGINSGPDSFDVRVRARDGNGGEDFSPPDVLGIEFVPPAITSVAFARSDNAVLSAPGFWSLGDLPGGVFESVATDVSADGSVIVGRGSTDERYLAFRWTIDEGMQALGAPAGDLSSAARAISADGSVIAGVGRGGAFDFRNQPEHGLGYNAYDHPFRWTESDGLVSLEIPEDGHGASTPNGLSADGSIIVGEAYWDDWTTGVRWTDAGVEHVLATPERGVGGPVFDVSADGEIVTGSIHSGPNYGDVYRFTGDLDPPEGISLGFQGTPTAISADGNVIVGSRGSGFDGSGFRWVNQAGLNNNFSLPSGGLPLDVSADGSVVVGESSDGAFVWTEADGAHLVADLLTQRGINLGEWQLSVAAGVSADGRVIVGYGINPQGDIEAWRADISPSRQLDVGDGQQLAPLPYAGLDEIIISFSEPVEVSSDDLTLGGVNVAEYPISNFQFDPSTRTASWRLEQSIAPDTLQLMLRSGNDGVHDIAGNSLDGDWDNPTSPDDDESSQFPSGGGQPGGDFSFQFRVLPGDANRDGVVNAEDFNIWNNDAFTEASSQRMTGDFNGDGLIDVSDFNIWNDNKFKEPGPAQANPLIRRTPRAALYRQVQIAVDSFHRFETLSQGHVEVRSTADADDHSVDVTMPVDHRLFRWHGEYSFGRGHHSLVTTDRALEQLYTHANRTQEGSDEGQLRGIYRQPVRVGCQFAGDC